MTAWGVGSLVPSVSTIQSSRTSEIFIDRKEAVSAGILSPIFDIRGLRRTITVSRVDFGLRSLHRKIPFPATELALRALQVEASPYGRSQRGAILRNR
jgi:hypothetical protein